MTVFERLTHCRMQRARQLLEETDLLVQDVATESGYESVTGFVFAFKRMHKVSPQRWRNKFRGLE